MAEDFPSAASLYASTRSRDTAPKKRKAAKRRKTAAKPKAADRRAMAEGAEDIWGDAEATPNKGKSALDRVADKVTADLWKKAKGKRKPSAAQRRQNKEQASDLAEKLMGIGNTPIGSLAKKGGALAIGATAALALIAGVASYYGTTYIIDRLAAAREARTPQAVKFQAAMAYREARLEAARKLGRQLSDAEQNYLGQQFKAKLASIGG